MAYSLGEAAMRVLTGVRTPARSGTTHRTGCPVWRGSVEAGSVEDAFFAVPAKGETDRLLRTARAALDAGRALRRDARAAGRDLSAAERPIAALTPGAVRVFEEICTLARLNAGRVFPTYDYLARATALGRATVARALNLLEAAGLLLRQRRFRRATGDGPRYRQTSNLYRPLTPGGLLRFLPRRFHPAPLPADQIVREADRIADVAAMRATLNCRELAEAMIGGPLGQMLARLGAAVDRAQPESHSGLQPHIESIRYGQKDSDLVGH